MNQDKIVRDKKGRFVKGERSNNIIDLVGLRFGLLKVIKLAPICKGNTQWLCKCDCGNFSIVTSQSLRSGRTKSCGCFKRERQKIGKGEAAFNQLFNGYKCHSKRYKRGFSFLLTKKEFKKLTKQNCFYCGQKPSQSAKTRSNNGGYIYNGIDRLNNNKGYEIDNCVTCCKNCNLMKKTLSQEEFLNHINKICEYQLGRNKSVKKSHWR
ncbi:hypothetical protein KAX97_11920 [candidate division WOR-3 bacterium]|nr:hypothetical protein [candidate division WOR-3 bacterium]